MKHRSCQQKLLHQPEAWPSGYGARFKRSKASLSNESPGNVSCVGSNPAAFNISFASFFALHTAVEDKKVVGRWLVEEGAW